MKIIMGSRPTTAAKLSNDWGPPLDRPAPTQRPADDTLSHVIHGVCSKNVLGQINADSANFQSGWLLLLVVVDDNHTLAARCREREPSTSSASRAEANIRGGIAEGLVMTQAV